MTQESAETPPRASRGTRRERANLASGLSDRQRELMEACLAPGIKTVKAAADQLGWKADAAYQMILRIKMGDAKASGYHNEVAYYKVKFAKQGKRFLED